MATLAQEIIADSPLAYWRSFTSVREGGFLILHDTVGADNFLTGYETPVAPTIEPSLIPTEGTDSAMGFTPGNNFWNPEKSAAFDLTAAFSLSYWMKPGIVGDQNRDVVRKGTYGSLIGTDSKLHAFMKQGGVTREVISGTTIVVGTIYHIGITFDGSNLKLFINGIQDGTLNSVGALDVSNIDSFVLGAFSDVTHGYNGILDEVALFSSGLTAGRIAAHYTAGAGTSNSSDAFDGPRDVFSGSSDTLTGTRDTFSGGSDEL